MEKDQIFIEVISVTKGFRPNGEQIILVDFGFKDPGLFPDKGEATLMIPQNNMATIEEWKFKIWINEKNWHKMKRKYTVGEIFKLETGNLGEISIKRIKDKSLNKKR